MLEALKVIAFLASQIEGASVALKAVSEVIQNARDQNREPTLEEIKGISLGAERAIDALSQAIEEAEE